MNSSTRITGRLTIFVNAWASLRPTKSFAGMTLEEFKLAIAPSVEARARLAHANEQVDVALVDRDNADQQTARILDRVVGAVVADQTEGYDGALYAALGYVRKSERSSGLTRRAFVQPSESATPAIAKAA